MKLFGFSLLRNGLKYDYPFRESLESLGELTGNVYLALGKSEDGTEKAVSNFKFLKIIPSLWDDQLREGGKILSQQTNVALDALRAEHKDVWGFYLQADEVIHEDDFEKIKIDLKNAQEQGFDAVSFRYFHFWLTYDQICIGKRWYPQEIRAIKLNSDIKSYGDAQSFSNVKKVYESDAFIYHYGHVREAAKYELKKQDFHRYWHDDETMIKKIAQAKVDDSKEETLKYLGPHPKFMRSRMGNLKYEKVDHVSICGVENNYSPKVRNSICAIKVEWVGSSDEKCVDMKEPKFWFLGGGIPSKMRSKNAREFPNDLKLILKLSQAGIGVGP